MSEEAKVYQFNEYILSYDKSERDRSCLTISKTQNGNIYVMSELLDGSADVVSMILDSLQTTVNYCKQENKILRENAEHNDKVVELLKEENERLKIQISVREEVCSRIASNWNLLKRYCYEVENDENTKLNGLNVLDKIQELEQGKDE